MRALSTSDKQFLIEAYDHRTFIETGEFHAPAARRVRNLERIYLQLQEINNKEPFDHDQRVRVVKRWLRSSVIVDAPPLAAWKVLHAEAQAVFDQAYTETRTFLEQRVYADKALLRELDKHRRRLEKQQLEDERIAQYRATHEANEAAHKEAEADAQTNDAKKWSRDESDRVRRLNKEQDDFYDYLERKDRRWRDTFN